MRYPRGTVFEPRQEIEKAQMILSAIEGQIAAAVRSRKLRQHSDNTC